MVYEELSHRGCTHMGEKSLMAPGSVKGSSNYLAEYQNILKLNLNIS